MIDKLMSYKFVPVILVFFEDGLKRGRGSSVTIVPSCRVLYLFNGDEMDAFPDLAR